MNVELNPLTARAVLKTLRALPLTRSVRDQIRRLAEAIVRYERERHARRVSETRRYFHGEES